MISGKKNIFLLTFTKFSSNFHPKFYLNNVAKAENFPLKFPENDFKNYSKKKNNKITVDSQPKIRHMFENGFS